MSFIPYQLLHTTCIIPPMPHKKAKHNDLMQNRASLTRFAWLSIGAAVSTILLKTTAYLLTGSVGLLSDAIELLVNLVGACMALGMLIIAARPADESHVYGHSKAEYFASATEGLLSSRVSWDSDHGGSTPAQSASARTGGAGSGSVGAGFGDQPFCGAQVAL